MQHTNSISEFFHLEMHLSNEKTHTNLDLVPPAFAPLLHQFSSLFQEPQDLPPFRSNNHHILLLLNSPPINVRPYRYPHFLKIEIEKLLHDILQLGTIQPSTSAFFASFTSKKKRGR